MSVNNTWFLCSLKSAGKATFGDNGGITRWDRNLSLTDVERTTEDIFSPEVNKISGSDLTRGYDEGLIIIANDDINREGYGEYRSRGYNDTRRGAD